MLLRLSGMTTAVLVVVCALLFSHDPGQALPWYKWVRAAALVSTAFLWFIWTAAILNGMLDKRDESSVGLLSLSSVLAGAAFVSISIMVVISALQSATPGYAQLFLLPALAYFIYFAILEQKARNNKVSFLGTVGNFLAIYFIPIGAVIFYRRYENL